MTNHLFSLSCISLPFVLRQRTERTDTVLLTQRESSSCLVHQRNKTNKTQEQLSAGRQASSLDHGSWRSLGVGNGQKEKSGGNKTEPEINSNKTITMNRTSLLHLLFFSLLIRDIFVVQEVGRLGRVFAFRSEVHGVRCLGEYKIIVGIPIRNIASNLTFITKKRIYTMLNYAMYMFL